MTALARWRALLAELAVMGDALGRAMAGGDIAGAIAAGAQVRRVRDALGRVEAPTEVAEAPAALEALADIAASLTAARAATEAAERWLARPLPPDDQLLATPLGVAVLADAIVPAVWDFETDVVVLIGDALAPVIDVLVALGQRRIVLVGHAAGTAATVVESAAEAGLAVRMMTPNPPARLAVRATADTLPALAADVPAALRDALADLRIHRNTVRAFSRAWVEQGLANLPALGRWPSIAAVGDRFAGVPMVIVAPGPSLARNAAQLRALKGRAIITAFSHSLKPVLAAGVVPDLVVTVDPQDVSYHFAGCSLRDSYLVNAATVHPALFDLPARGCLTLAANSAIDDWIFDGLGEEARVPGGGSVATTAFSLALRWRCDPIIFVGLDLSFPGGAYYVETSTDGGARANVDADGVMTVGGWSRDFHAMKATGGPAAVGERAVELPGWHGGTVPSSFMFALFHRWFEERMRSVEGTRVYNCTEGGAAIAGMIHVPLADLVAQRAHPVHARAILDRVVAAVDPQRAARLAAHLDWFAHGLRRSRRLARKARELIARDGPEARLAQLEQALAVAMRPLAFASLLAQREVERATELAARPDADHLAASAVLLDTLVGVVDQLAPALRRAHAELVRGRAHGYAA